MPYDRYDNVKIDRKVMDCRAKLGGTDIVVGGNTDAIAINKTKLDLMTVTQAVDLDTMESNVATNNAKNTYPSADATIVAAIPAGLSGYEARIAALEAKMEFIPKAFGRFTTADPAVLLGTSYNVASVSRAATGRYSVVIADDLETANYTIIVAYEDSTATIQTAMVNTLATTGFNIGLRDASNAFSDASESVSFVVYENNT